jgi:hypothetical protein
VQDVERWGWERSSSYPIDCCEEEEQGQYISPDGDFKIPLKQNKKDRYIGALRIYIKMERIYNEAERISPQLLRRRRRSARAPQSPDVVLVAFCSRE